MPKHEVHHHPDGWVYVRTPTQTYVDTRANFAADYGTPIPPLPLEADERIYTQGVRHALMARGEPGMLEGGEMPWPFGDEVIAGIDSLMAAKAARESSKPAPDAPA